jgi:hypothetical protein
MSDKMELLVEDSYNFSQIQIVNELVRKIPRAKLDLIVKITKHYKNNKSKYNSYENINEIIIDCIKYS